MKGWEDGTKTDMLCACQSIFFVTGGNYSIWKRMYFRSNNKISSMSHKTRWRKERLSPHTLWLQPQNISVLCTFPQGWYLTELSLWNKTCFFLVLKIFSWVYKFNSYLKECAWTAKHLFLDQQNWNWCYQGCTYL